MITASEIPVEISGTAASCGCRKCSSRVGVTEPRLLQVEAFFGRYGLATILVGRFVGFVRPIAPFLAGASRYPRRRFAALAVLGTGLWSATFVLLGFVFWQSFDQAVAIAKRGTLGLGITVALVIAIAVGYRFLRSRLRAGCDSPPGREARPRPRHVSLEASADRSC